MRRRTKEKLGASIAVIAAIVALPVLLPWALISHYLENRRLLAAAKTLPCPLCQMPLGEKSLELAAAVRSEEIAELHRKHPGVKFRLVRMYDVICTNCAARLNFDDSTRTFSAINDIIDGKPSP